MKSYFTFLDRNKLYTAIQFFGLAIALGVVILLTSYADTEFNIGNNQSYSHQLYTPVRDKDLLRKVPIA